MKEQPGGLKGKGYKVMFQVAAETKGRAALPLMEHFETHSTDKWVRNNARQAREIILRNEEMERNPEALKRPPGFIPSRE